MSDQAVDTIQTISESYNAFVVYLDRSVMRNEDVAALINTTLHVPGVTKIGAPALSDVIKLAKAAFSIHPEMTAEMAIETLEMVLAMCESPDGRLAGLSKFMREREEVGDG